MTQTVSRLEGMIPRLRRSQCENAATPRSVDPNEFWKRLALKAIGDGSFKSADDFVSFIEACTRYLSFDQVMRDRPYGIGIRSLAEAIARQWACGNAPKNALTADEIAGLLQSEWVTSGEFRLLGSGSDGCDSGCRVY
jgi:hypothetical protein